MKECHGKRLEAYDKCEKCDDIISCSIITLENKFQGVNIIAK